MENLLCIADLAATGTPAPSEAVGGSGFDFTAVFLILSLAVAVALPIAFVVLGKIKYKGSFLMVLKGILGYIVFYMILAAIISMILLPRYSDQNSTYVEASIYIAIQIICMELGRFLFLFMGRKKHNSWGDGILFGAGYCMMDMLVIVIGFLLPYLIITLSPNVSELDGAWREMRVFVKEANLVSGKEWRFLVKALTCLVFCGMHMSSALLMHTAIQKNVKWLIVMPLIVDALIMIPNRLSSYGVWFWKHNAVILPYLAIITVLCCLFTYIMWKNIYQAQAAEVDVGYFEKLTGKTDEKGLDNKEI